MAASDLKDETPLQRFHRLQFEVKKLVEDLKEVNVVNSILTSSQNPNLLFNKNRLAPLKWQKNFTYFKTISHLFSK
jgi:hypothetical protein